MSAAERDRGCLVRQAVEGRVSQREASERLGIGVRQFKRLVRAWRRDGDAGLVSRQRGRLSHRRLSEALRVRIGELLRGTYADFGPTLAAEKLLERDGIKVSAETVRRLQIALGLWRPKRRRVKRVFQLRERRPRFGELVQIDGSPHDWFERRGPRCTLIVFIDDATGRLTALRFAPVESCKAYLETLRDQVLTHGCPLAFYSDRHGIFRVNAKEAESGDGKTEFGRVVERLGIGLINALTPQAKGRVERANQTLQDRLIKEMRLRDIGSIEAAQGFLPSFMLMWNARFAVEPRDTVPAHRPWTQTADALDLMLARHQERTLSKALTFSYGGTKYCVKTNGPGTALRGAKVLVRQLTDGRLHVTYKDRVLALTAYGTYPVPDPAADEKTLDVRLDAINAAQQTAGSMISRRGDGLKPGASGAPLRGFGA
ncbi:MAG TPA: ISNCY family transposase [Acetobacteraceae bacterium]|nr:ISNCY family transposase [Acetobacteraceae bacterium]